MENTLQHYGTLGMKWGRRKTSSVQTSTVKKTADTSSTTETTTHNKTHTMSDSELRDKITRLELEKRYKDLTKQEVIVKQNKGRKFVTDILEKSGKTVGEQLTTYMMGQAINKMMGANVIGSAAGKKKSDK